MTIEAGFLVHRSADRMGPIEVIEQGGLRSLHFGSTAKQSALFLHDPTQLALSYTRAMTVPLLFHPSPERILLVGLGGGSLATFLLHHLPDCRIDAVEMREAVVEVAHSHFQLPRDDRLSVHVEDAGDFIHGPRYQGYGDYDLILIDAFVDNGISRSVCGSGFFAQCRRRLSDSGWLSMNLWSGDFIRASDLLREMAGEFEHPPLRLEIEGRDNVIGLACRGRNPLTQLSTPAITATALQQRLQIEYPALLKRLRNSNR